MTTTYASKLTATDEFAAVMNPTGAAPAVSNVFRPKFGQAKASTSQTALPPSVDRAVGTADQLAQIVKSDMVRWAKIVKDSGAKID